VAGAAAVLPPQNYRVVTSSPQLAGLYHLPDSVIVLTSSFPALNQSGDVIVLRDASGWVIDSLHYENDWGRSQKSIEKIWFERENLHGKRFSGFCRTFITRL
jgi:hypothetical protein